MAINACTINGFTLNSRRCTNKFTALIPILHPQKKLGGNPQQAKYKNYLDRETWKPPVLSTELDRIIVTIKFLNLMGKAEQENTQRLDLVYVTNLKFETENKLNIAVNDLSVNNVRIK